MKKQVNRHIKQVIKIATRYFYQVIKYLKFDPCGNVSDCKNVSDCRSRCRELDPSLVPYFSRD